MNALADPRPAPPDYARWALWTARALVTAWAAFWVWFNVASGVTEMAEHGPGDLVAHGLLAVVILGVAFAAWRWRAAGGLALLATAVVFAIVFGFGVAAILLAPPALAGVLLLVSARNRR